MKRIFKKIRVLLFGDEKARQEAKPPPPPPVKKTRTIKAATPAHIAPKRKEPYFIQIGFDFGTSYSKCVCRDIMVNKAWAHTSSRSGGQECPFLIPSALSIENGKILHVKNFQIHYPEKGLYHLKHALVKVAQGLWEDPVLNPYRNVTGVSERDKLAEFVESCAVYFLASTLGEVRERIRQRFRGFGQLPEDYMAVNLAIPVGDAEQPEVSKLYNRILREAWDVADRFSGYPPIDMNDLKSLRTKTRSKGDGYNNEACFIYPEVSANVQGFVRSRVSAPGIYLFSDTGGGTVDQSIFIFIRDDKGEHLTYLTGRVLPLGSSNIERRAAEIAGTVSWQSLENWRERKERSETASELRQAQGWIAEELNRETRRTLALAKQKLFVPGQLNSMKVIFGGGGHCEYPYKKAALLPFSGDLFYQTVNPDVIGLPKPRDLELKGHEIRWMHRLSVAYGLSFVQGDLAPFTYPKDVSKPTPDEIWQPRKPGGHAPTKDEC